MRVITLKVDEKLLEELDRYAMRNGMTRSEAIRKAIKEFLRRHGVRRFKFSVRRVVIT